MSRKKKLRAIEKMLSGPSQAERDRLSWHRLKSFAGPANTTLAKSTEMQLVANALLWKSWGTSPDPAEREAFRQLSADPRNAHYERGI